MDYPFQEYAVDAVDDIVTNADLREVSHNYALKMRGVLNFRQGMICQRDYGTKRIQNAPPGVTIWRHEILNDPVTQTEHLVIFGIDGAGNSVIYVYDGEWVQVTAGSAIFNIANGSTPHVRFKVEEVLRKLNIYYGTSANPTVLRNPVELKKWASTGYFYASSSPLTTLSEGWRMEKGGGGLIPTLQEVGSPTAPLDYTTFSSAPTGTVSVTEDENTVTGVGTAFLTEFKVGQYIQVGTLGDRRRRRVKAIASNESLTIDGTWPLTLSGTMYRTIVESDTAIGDGSSGDWLLVRLFRMEEGSDVDNSAIDKKYKAQIIITALYDDGTKESDPIYRAYLGNANSSISTFARTTLGLFIKFANMNKRISGLRVYEERSEQIDVGNYGEWDNGYTITKMIFEVKFNENQADAQWKSSLINIPAGYDYGVILPDFTFSYVDGKLKAAPRSLVGNLGRAPDFNRSYLAPPFAVKAGRTQGAIVVVPQGERTLRFSTYNGDIIHEEDNFPDIAVDTRNFIQKVALNGRGSIVALRVMDDVVYIFRDFELETWDLQSLQTSIKPEPCVSGESVVQSKHGISFAGPGAIQHIPRGGGGIYTLNPLWQNLYDGSLFIDDGSVQYLTDTERQKIIGGYHELYEEAWFSMKLNRDIEDGGNNEYVCAIYSFPRRKWRFRKLSIGTGGQAQPRSFVSLKDGNLSIGYESAILRYPNRSGARLWEDDVNADDSTNNKGVETEIMFNIGGLSNAIPHAILKGFKFLHKGSTVDKGGLARVRLYANDETRAFDDKEFRIDDPPQWRGIDRRGSVEALRVRVNLPTTGITNFKDFDLAEFILGYTTNGVQGNR